MSRIFFPPFPDIHKQPLWRYMHVYICVYCVRERAHPLLPPSNAFTPMHANNMTHPYMWYDSLMSMTWLIDIYGMNRWCISDNSLIIATWRIYIIGIVCTHTHTRTHTHKHTHTHTNTPTHPRTHTNTHTHTLSLTHTHTHLHINTHTHTHTHSHTSLALYFVSCACFQLLFFS